MSGTGERAPLGPLWEEMVSRWGGVVGGLARTADEARALPGVPAAWVDLLGSGDPVARAAGQWRDMPRFARHLASSTLDVAVGTGIGGPVLAYLVADWVETRGGGYAPGLMIGGIPAPADALARLQDRVGEIPAGLRGAWQAHGFVLLKNGRWLGSLVPEGERLAGPPGLAPGSSRGWVGDAQGPWECLEVLDPGRAITGCLVRRPGERAWTDHVVYRESRGSFRDSDRPTLEMTFTDWETSEFEG